MQKATQDRWALSLLKLKTCFNLIVYLLRLFPERTRPWLISAGSSHAAQLKLPQWVCSRRTGHAGMPRRLKAPGGAFPSQKHCLENEVCPFLAFLWPHYKRNPTTMCAMIYPHRASPGHRIPTQRPTPERGHTAILLPPPHPKMGNFCAGSRRKFC